MTLGVVGLNKNEKVCNETLKRNFCKSLLTVIMDLFFFPFNNIARCIFQKDSSLGKHKYQSTEDGILMN